MDSDFVHFSAADTEQDESAPALLTECVAPWLKGSSSASLSTSSSSSARKRAADDHPPQTKVPSLIRLHNEILTFCDYAAPSPEDFAARGALLKELTELLVGLWPGCQVHTFGSQMTGILTPSSDLDLTVLNVTQECEDPLDLLHILSFKIRDAGIATYVEAITHAKIPIVKLDHSASGISVDICINEDSGLKTGERLKNYVREYPPLRPLTIVLKMFLSQRRLNETYSGGMGSFVLSCLVVSFLQMKQRLAVHCGSTPVWNLGALLLEFLQLYGLQFNTMVTGISIENGGEYFPKRKRKVGEAFSARPNMLYLENPDLPELDMGKGTFMMPKIRRAFEHAHQLLTCAIADGNNSENSSNNGGGSSNANYSDSFLAFVIRSDDPRLAGRRLKA